MWPIICLPARLSPGRAGNTRCWASLVVAVWVWCTGRVATTARSGHLKEQRSSEPLKPAEVAESRQLFNGEAERVLSLSHPNVVSGEDFFTWKQRQYFVMELVNGETLEKRLREANAPAFEQDALRWTVQMARVLGYLHLLQPPIIYRDLKPANVILTPDGTIKFIDFGVARTHKLGKSKDTVAIGTFGYAPPEQYGKGQTDARSDVYTLGATLFHLLTNLPPRPLYTPKVGEIKRLDPSVQPQTEQIVIRAMQQDRDARYASAAEMERDLQAALAQPLPEEPGLLGERLPSGRRWPRKGRRSYLTMRHSALPARRFRHARARVARLRLPPAVRRLPRANRCRRWLRRLAANNASAATAAAPTSRRRAFAQLRHAAAGADARAARRGTCRATRRGSCRAAQGSPCQAATC